MPEQIPTLHLGASEPVIGTVALAPVIATGGTFPQPGPGPATNVLAMVHMMAAPWPAFGASRCDGSQVKVYANQPLFAELGTSYGGSGTVDFDLPDLRGRVAISGSLGLFGAGSLAMTWMIAAQGGEGVYPMTGALGLFAALNPPAGWLAADGSRLPLAENVALFEAIGTTFGGDGQTWFALPDLQGRTVVGAGQGEAVTIALGQAIDVGPDTPVACLGLDFLINTTGDLPPQDGDGGFPNSASVLGEVIAIAGASVPTGWVAAAGQEMPIAGNQDLFEMIGTTFGGDGEISFALPDLRARMAAGLGA